MTELSSQAQAVLDAAYKRMDDNPHNEVEATLAAALRAAADQVVHNRVCRMELHLIAEELEAQQ